MFAKWLADRGDLTGEELGVFERLSAHLNDGDFDAPQPSLVAAAGHEVARTHGDLWSGNVLYSNSATGVTLIDPHAQGQHAETDLASLAVFNAPFVEDVYAAYNEASPLADGWRSRVALHELAMITMHAYKYGGGYITESVQIARSYV